MVQSDNLIKNYCLFWKAEGKKHFQASESVNLVCLSPTDTMQMAGSNAVQCAFLCSVSKIYHEQLDVSASNL